MNIIFTICIFLGDPTSSISLLNVYINIKSRVLYECLCEVCSIPVDFVLFHHLLNAGMLIVDTLPICSPVCACFACELARSRER